MASQLTIPETFQVGHVSAALASLYTSKKSLFGGTILRPVPPLQIQIISDVLQWSYEGGAETDQNNRLLANYLYWLCGLFGLQAQNIISGPGGGSVVPTPSGGATPNDLDFIVSASSFMVTGATSVSIPQFIGYNVDFARNGTVQYTTPQPGGAQYYSWNNVTGIFTLLGDAPAALEGEAFRIMVDAGGDSSAVVPTATFPFVVTSADFEADGVTLLDSRITGNSIYLLSNNVPNPVLTATADFVYVAGGIEVVLSGFNSNTFNYTIVINKIN